MDNGRSLTSDTAKLLGVAEQRAVADVLTEAATAAVTDALDPWRMAVHLARIWGAEFFECGIHCWEGVGDGISHVDCTDVRHRERGVIVSIGSRVDESHNPGSREKSDCELHVGLSEFIGGESDLCGDQKQCWLREKRFISLAEIACCERVRVSV